MARGFSAAASLAFGLVRRGRLGLKIFKKGEVELSPFQVSAGYADADLVAEGIDFMMLTAAQALIALVELVVVALQIAKRNHTLAFILVDFYVEAELRNAADCALIFLSDALTHKLHLFVLYT